MVYTFDIFKLDAVGNALWRDSAENFVAAKTQVAKLSAVAPGEYLIFDHRTQEKIVIDLALTPPGQAAV